MAYRPVVLLVLDGFGVAPAGEGNAITQAKTPNFTKFTARYPVVTLRASSEEVGLGWGEMGNSEVGHLAIGAGRVYYQTLPRLNRAMVDGSFGKNEALQSAYAAVQKTGGTLHIMGLMSAGKVHSSDEHCFALLQAAKAAGVTKCAVHAFLDGRDTLYNSGVDFIQNLQGKMKELGIGELATLSGRFYAMDRDNRWERIEAAYRAIVEGRSEHTAEDATQALRDSYAREVYDEEFPPTVLTRGGQPMTTVKPGDAVIFFNFRPDRARQLTRAFVLPAFDHFTRPYLNDLTFVTMTEYESGLPVKVAFGPEKIDKTLAEVISDAGLVQLHAAETEKYAHVTFFLNGTREQPFPHEDRALIPSPHVATYDQAPAMSAPALAERLVEAIKQDNYDFIVANFANADMVGHTGNFEATVSAIETLDACVGQVVEAALAAGGAVVITADHGNGEEVKNIQTGDIDKEHSTNPVPCWIIQADLEGKPGLSGDVPEGDLSLLPPVGMLADIAPTVLALLGLTPPSQMTGTSLLP
jgi:2,3-bisphosphoglycerate-independent phosphoglycerate mutase